MRYGIRISNPTSNRVEAVVSVDGRDAISGQVADFVRHRGYVIPPFGSVTVTGFRQSLEQVASFRFTDPGDSYSSRMGTPQNVGVVGVAFFTEKQREPVAIAQPRRSRAEGSSAAPRRKTAHRSAPAEDRAAAPTAKPRSGAARERRFEPEPRGAVNNIGTEYGESRFSPVRTVSFRRQSPASPTRIVRLRYDDEQGLEARGIRVHPPRHWGGRLRARSNRRRSPVAVALHRRLPELCRRLGACQGQARRQAPRSQVLISVEKPWMDALPQTLACLAAPCEVWSTYSTWNTALPASRNGWS